jgi:hypothetical protein
MRSADATCVQGGGSEQAASAAAANSASAAAVRAVIDHLANWRTRIRL